jgi:hypothetical protein
MRYSIDGSLSELNRTLQHLQVANLAVSPDDPLKEHGAFETGSSGR